MSVTNFIALSLIWFIVIGISIANAPWNTTPIADVRVNTYKKHCWRSI
ncbi:MAG: hypothetical protein QXU99_01490 [Candidatus Bathyarchaeia archaeon]